MVAVRCAWKNPWAERDYALDNAQRLAANHGSRSTVRIFHPNALDMQI